MKRSNYLWCLQWHFHRFTVCKDQILTILEKGFSMHKISLKGSLSKLAELTKTNIRKANIVIKRSLEKASYLNQIVILF